ncbi:hypothetical protein HYQ45_010492 [Verticillium longisporum]|uniref:SWR1-complex protein 3 domain-containing protein n=1 Tax=Verticillium longisporum TaxID=100787 RepID=A0A8I3APE1_VERLO|nr:hypothetical protein HYQ45_010492 [Verticillium longisporum]
MERKRKLPARAAARVDHIAKKRTSTPPDRLSPYSRAPTPPPQSPLTAEVPQLQLPKSVQPGKPLPTVEQAQSDDLTLRDYQNIQESGVLAESLTRSRQRWIAEGIFEKYWTKPTKKKGVVIEEPNNPPKDSMSKVGQVTITIEPHVFEATMWAIKDPKPPPVAPTTQATFRPIMQYGPPNGSMPPPPPPPKSESSPSITPVPDAKSTPPPASPATSLPAPQAVQPRPQPASGETVAATGPPRSVELAPAPAPTPAQAPAQAPAPTPAPAPAQSQGPALAPAPSPVPSAAPSYPPTNSMSPAPRPSAPASLTPTTPSASAAVPAPYGGTAATVNVPSRPSSTTPTQGGSKPPPTPKTPGTDPIIMTLAEKASEDPHLRDLMKRVAAGEAKQDELTNFQRIIDQITAEYKKKGGQQGPSADRLIVDGKTVKYFADEVRTILDIVLATNPQQKSHELLPPPGSDPLVVALVKKALDDAKTRTMIRRIADNQPGFTDTTDLKAILDKLHKALQAAPPPQIQPRQIQSPQPTPSTNGQLQKVAPAPGSVTHPPQQALRSKGPPPPSKPDVSGIALEFAGGNGDRYLFPKFSILEYLPGGQQVIASFLIVRKGSQLEYGGDAKLDYYQPVTIRLFTQTGRQLDHLHRVVAPPEEVKRYMVDVMDNMTRAEYVLLAMRLPRGDPPVDKDQGGREATSTNGNGPEVVEPVLPPVPAVSAGPKKPPILWKGKAKAFMDQFPAKEIYQQFLARKRQGFRERVDEGYKPYRWGCELLNISEDEMLEYDTMVEKLAAKQIEES